MTITTAVATVAISLSSPEKELCQQAARAAGLSVSKWAAGAVASACHSKTSALAAGRDAAELAGRLLKPADRRERSGVVLDRQMHALVVASASGIGITTHAFIQATMILGAERAMRARVATLPRRDAAQHARSLAPLPASIVAMLDAMDAGLWPGRATGGIAAGDRYLAGLAWREKLRAGIVRRADAPASSVAELVAEHPTCRDVSAMLMLPIDLVARAVVMRCGL